MKLKLFCLLSICLLMGSCSGGTSNRVTGSDAFTSAPSVSTSTPQNTNNTPSTSGSNVSYVPMTCSNGSVVNALTQTCPVGQDGANQLANDWITNKTNSVIDSYK